MILFQNSLICISYASDVDIMTVEWPDFEPYTTFLVTETLNKVTELIRNYDVKNLLIDASRAKVEVKYSEYQEIVRNFLLELNSTRLVKLARVTTSDPEREANINTLRSDSALNYEFHDFSSKEDAIWWLTNI